ncbi:kinesin-4-like protein [Trifolium medium]|uniref:Kinesin-4-like protein n=1 Tax=Trifolium medium TaxID=97028 RepID=A0A392PN99_9FABA|nr:kinesin-4-like protein [Trifolium medium]
MRQKTQSIDFDEISANSPPWPPVNSLGQNDGEDDKETGSGEWVDKSYNNMFMGGNQFSSIMMGSDDNMDEIDAATSDYSSEPDLLWQFNHSKLTSLTNGIGSKTIMRSVSKATKSPELSKSYVHSSLGPSPSFKQSKVVSHRTGRSPAPIDMKRKTGSRK